MNENTVIRLAACDMIRTRFVGRAELRRRAARSTSALDALEARLGLISEAERQLRANERSLVAAFARARAIQARVDAWMARPYEWHEPIGPRRLKWGPHLLDQSVLLALRNERRTRQERPAPVRAVERHALRVAERRYQRAGFRSAAHAHNVEVRLGAPDARSSSCAVSSYSAGMSKAYCRKQFTVTESTHTLTVDASLLSVPAPAKGSRELLLSPTVRVRQGRGTALVVERLTVGPTGRLGWR